MGSPTPGAAKLREYINRHHPAPGGGDGSITAFCRAHGLDRVHVSRVLSAQRTRINADLIRNLHAATQGEVPWWSWTTNGEAPADVVRGAQPDVG